MLGDMYSPEGNEIAMGPVIGIHSGKTFIVYSGNITDNNEPYIVFEDYNTKKVARISMLEPKYLPSDIKISKDDLTTFNQLVHKKWESLKGRYDFVVNNVYKYNLPLPEDLQCPDYTKLESDH